MPAYIAASFDGTGAAVKIERLTMQAVIYISNNDSMTQDALVLGHIDVVKAADGMFAPKMKTAECTGAEHWMKSFAAVAMNSMHYVLEHKPAVKFGVILSTDEEQGSKSTHVYGALSG